MYEAVSERDGQVVIAKVFDIEDEADEGRVQHEFELIRRLDIEGIVRALDLRRVGDQLVLLLERIPGANLAEFAAGRPVPLRNFWPIAVQIADILARTHAARVIHRDIKPANILLDTSTQRVYLADFGISVLLENERRHIYDSDVFVGTLPYISPEQTGRTSRAVDFRSDLYSLGVTFYELLTAQRPFDSRDPLELIHAHLAREADAPITLRADLPVGLSRMIMKLLAKSPDQRYQTASGLAIDLRELQRLHESGDDTRGFELGSQDRERALRTPQGLFGRERELEQIENIFATVTDTGTRQTLALTGPIGVGKSALVAQLEATVVGRNGYLIRGEFTADGSQPYAGFAQAFSALFEQLLTESDARLERWRRLLLGGLGSFAGAIHSIAPAFEIITGVEADSAGLEAAEARNRLQVAVERLIAVICSTGPLILVLENLHHADAGSVRLLEALVYGEAGPLLIVPTLRPEAIPLGHPLRTLSKELEDHPRVEVMTLEGLSVAAITRFVSEALTGLEEPEGFAQILRRKTNGIPLFVTQLLPRFVDSGAIEAETSRWVWDQAAVEAEAIPDDAVGMMHLKLGDLGSVAQEVLGQAACVGYRFDLDRLSWICDHSKEQLGTMFVEFEDQGLVTRVANGYRFAHKSIHAAARVDLDPELVSELRWTLGRVLEPRADESVALLFEAVDHLDAGAPANLEEETRLELAALNLKAGEEALGALNYTLAHRYLMEGLALVAPERERVLELGPEAPAYELMFRLHFCLASQLALAGQREAADAAFVALLEWKMSDLHFAEAVAKRLSFLWVESRQPAAVELGLAALARLGLEVPAKPERGFAIQTLIESWGLFKGATLESLARMPQSEDERSTGIINIIVELKTSAFVVDNSLFLYFIGLHAELCSKHGSHPSLGRALSDLSIGVNGVLGRVAEGERLLDLGCELARTRPGGASETRLLSVAGLMTLHRSRVFAQLALQFDSGYQSALEGGEFDSASFLGVFGIGYQFEVGTHLRVLSRRCRTLESEIGRWCPKQMRIQIEVLRGLCAAFIGGSSDGDEGGATAVWDLDPEVIRERGGTPANCHVALLAKAQHGLVCGDSKEALSLCERFAIKGERVVFNTFEWARGCVLLCVSYYMEHLAGAPETPELVEKVGRCQATLESWAQECPGNYGHYLDLVEGLAHATRDQGQLALESLDRAWAEARQRGCRWIEGIAAEQLVAQYKRQGLRAPVEGVIRRAWDAYMAWGAEAKLTLLKREYPGLFSDAAMARRDTAFAGNDADTATVYGLTRSVRDGVSVSAHSTPSLDLGQVLRSVGAISEDLRLEEVIARVLDAALTNVGADHGLLVLEQGGSQALVAESFGVGEREIFADPPLLRDAIDRAPTGLVNFVTRTGKSVVLDDASADMRFAGDAYLERTEVKSVLAMPLLKGERRLGVLVLENHLTTHSFGAASLEALRLITSQAASTLENAQLYNELRRSQESWRSLVDGAPDLIALLDERGAVVFRNHDGPLRGIDETHDDVDEEGVLTQDSAMRWRSAVESVLQRGEREELELEFRSQFGRQWFAVRIAPIEVHRGFGDAPGPKHRNAVAVATDITSRRQAENEMRELEAQLRQQQRLESVGTLASGVAHEINNPIQGIMNYADLIYGNPTDRDLVEDFASEINHESQRVAKIVRNLLAFSRQDATEVPEAVQLADVVDSSLSLIRAVLRRDNITIDIEVADKLTRVMCRPQQIQQVIMNLVTNARDALNERYGEYNERKRIEISVAVSPREGWQTVSVQDWGGGIPADVLARIFDPFFTTKGRDQGTGLGLAVSHGIVQDHDSDLEVETNLGEGTCFSFQLQQFDPGED